MTKNYWWRNLSQSGLPEYYFRFQGIGCLDRLKNNLRWSPLTS